MRFESKRYRAWAKALPCCLCGTPSDDAHHVIGLRWNLSGMGMTAPDSFVMPLCRPITMPSTSACSPIGCAGPWREASVTSTARSEMRSSRLGTSLRTRGALHDPSIRALHRPTHQRGDTPALAQTRIKWVCTTCSQRKR